jgi:hypothetical protein
MEIFNLSDAPQYANQQATGEERIAKMFSELDGAIKKAVMLTDFDITSSSTDVFANGTSILSTITDKEIDRYKRERDWKIQAVRSLSINVKVPTYQYIITFPKEIAGYDVFIETEKDDQVFCGTTNSLSVLTVNLAKQLLSYGIHPHYLTNFIFVIKQTGQKFTIDKVDTDYNYPEVVARNIEGAVESPEVKQEA